MKTIRPLIIAISFLVLACGMQAQRRNSSYVIYIEQYKHLAVKHMKKYKIPASITMAQGLLESGAGNSTLARKSNNHFGIKCHTDWKGGRVYHDDDYRDECFRKYRHVEESYDDHSKFIALRSRYAVLFDLHIRDYKGWARGLQKCGYATDKAYANKLIKLIEDYDLYKLDSGKVLEPPKKMDNGGVNIPMRQVYKWKGLLYVAAQRGETYDDIARELGFKAKDLCKYNEVPGADFPLSKGDIVYLQKKKKKADKPNFEHVVEVGESMHSISQRFGIEMKSLYKMNKKDLEYIPEEGDVLRLR